MKRHSKGSDGLYHINGKTYKNLEGSRAAVWHGTAYKTAGDLTKDKLVYNKHGRIVSVRASKSAKKNKNLGSFKARKGDPFGPNKSHKKSKGKKR